MDTKHCSTLTEWSNEDGCFIGSAYPLVGLGYEPAIICTPSELMESNDAENAD